MPGETLVIADLQGPGLCRTSGSPEPRTSSRWPRLFRLRVYYDGRKTPSVDAPLGDFFGVGHGYEADLTSAMVYDTSLGRARNSYWPMPFRKSCRITVTNEGERMKSPLLPRRLAQRQLAARRRRILPRVLPAGAACRAGAQLRVPRDPRARAVRRHRAERGADRDLVVRRRRRSLLRGRRRQASDLRNRVGRLLQRGVGAARLVRAVDRIADRGGREDRREAHGLPLARARRDSVSEVDLGWHRASRLDLQPRRLPARAVRGAAGLLFERRILVPGGRERGSAGAAVRARPSPGRQRAAGSAGQNARRRGRQGRQGVHPEERRLGQGPAVARGLGSGGDDDDSVRRLRRRGATSS